MRFNYDLLVQRMLVQPERAAATDQTWAEWRFARALKHEAVLRKAQGQKASINIWDGEHAHLAALYIAERGKAADPRRFAELGKEQQRE